MATFQPFTLERMMSRFEKSVDYNLSESGVYPLHLRELLEMHPRSESAILDAHLDYAHTNGIPQLREHIAALYQGASADDVLVTVGAIEANFTATQALLSPGDEVVVMLPNYMQIWGLAKNREYQLKTFHLDESAGWAPDLDELREVVTPNTKLIAVCNPNNPTGRILTDAERKAIVDVAADVGAWILADEVYAGAERLTDTSSPSFFGDYDKVIAIGSLSKAYGLPGLRIGWLVAPPTLIDEVWARHEYTTICATMLSNHLAAIALDPTIRPRILERTRGYIRRGYEFFEQWMAQNDGLFEITAPEAAAIAFPRYRADINSDELAQRLIDEASTLVVAGDHFGLDHHLRISFGLPHDYLGAGLERVAKVLSSV